MLLGMTYDELRVQLDINDPVDVFKAVGKQYSDDKWFVVCDEGDCHLFNCHGQECDVREVKRINEKFIFKNIKKIVIPNSVTSIGNWAFQCCSMLMSVMIPNGVTNIGSYSFFGCSGLTSVTIGNGVMNIGAGAFNGCSGLTSVMVPDSVTSIGNGAFSNCSRLMSMTIGNGIMCIGNRAFSNSNIKCLTFKGKTIEEVKHMVNYPWEIKDESIIKCRS